MQQLALAGANFFSGLESCSVKVLYEEGQSSRRIMHNTKPIVQRYRRTDQDRLGEWASIDSTWKTPASSGLVAHDVYHHLPTDKGTFAQEVAALGAEWYINIQPFSGKFQEIRAEALASFGRNVSDTVLNALDYTEQDPFTLPERVAPAASAEEMQYFQSVACSARQELLASTDPRTQVENFEVRFIQNLLWGLDQARARFPDQRAVRRGSQLLSYGLADLELSEVPIGHDITITLQGYECTIEFTDADVPFVEEYTPEHAVLMRWCSFEQGYPVKYVTVHATHNDYADYVQRHFEEQDSSALADDAKRLPEGEASSLRPVYVVSQVVKDILAQVGSLTLSLATLQSADQSPRGVLVL